MSNTWDIQDGDLIANLSYEAAVASGSNNESRQGEDRIFFNTVTFNGTSPSSQLLAYEGGETVGTKTDFILNEIRLPADNKIGMHYVTISGVFHKDVYKQFTSIKFSKQQTTIVFSFDEPNKQQSCKPFDATETSNVWFQAIKPSSPIVILVTKDDFTYTNNKDQLYTNVVITGRHMVNYKNDYSLQNVDQLNIAKSVDFS
ncbi:hypothetical protein [Piscirickettsia litoralis]|uniref:Uncharacterized protein n=1 Tax=Piscirickettsia litoralis TaxID=1891921 RepID=A0ABX2ZXG5_9GAMM|nr:hypothetical protein [Piscirickettsia litoralis]ODN41252.1 hypothetical protein BGC07_16895 [Piscirickettsia litoralis]